MNKKVIALIIAILVIALGVGVYFVINSNNSSKVENQNVSSNSNSDIVAVEENNSQTENSIDVINNNTQVQNETVNEETSNKKVAVVYFSATGTTKTVAEYIKDVANADIFEIIPKQKYTSDDLNWNNSNSRSTKEQNDKNARPEIANNIDVSAYDVIFIGYPIWWGDTPRIIQTFMESHELNGKTMIPFCTSGGSGISGSENTLKSYSGINWISGKRLGTSKNEVENWVKSLNY